MSTFIKLNEIKQVEMIPGFKARFIHTANMTISYWEIAMGSKLPEHHHHHEQVSQVMEGKFELTINGVSQVMEQGKIAVIPSNAIHSGFAITACKVMDIFHPVREDYR